MKKLLLFLFLVSAPAFAQVCTVVSTGTVINPCFSPEVSLTVTLTPPSIAVGTTSTITTELYSLDGNPRRDVTTLCTYTATSGATIGSITTGPYAGYPNVATGTSPATVTITATCMQNGVSLIATAPLTVVSAPQITNPLTPCSPSPCLLSNGTNGTAYSYQLQAGGGTPPYTWSVTSGTLPTSLSLSTTGCTLTATQGNCNIQGTPSVAGTSTFTIQVSDSLSATASASMSITINPSSGGCTTATRGGSIQPPNYGNARIDSCPIAIGSLPNMWTNYGADYGYLGAGICTTGTTGLKQCRVTDGASDKAGFSWTNNYSGADTDLHWSADENFFTAGENSQQFTPIAILSHTGGVINSAKLISNAGTLFSVPSRSVAFDRDTGGLLYFVCQGCTGTGITANVAAIYSENISSCTATSCAPTPSLIYDFGATGNCLAGFSPTWNSAFFVTHKVNGQNIFSIGFSTTGGQGTGTIYAFYVLGSGPIATGCYVWNTGNTLVVGAAAILPGNLVGPLGAQNQVVMAASGYTPPSQPITGASCAIVGGGTIQLTYSSILNPPLTYKVNTAGVTPSGFNVSLAQVVSTSSSSFVVSVLGTCPGPYTSGGTASLTADLFTMHDAYSMGGISSGVMWSEVVATSCLWGGCTKSQVASGGGNGPYILQFPNASAIPASLAGHECFGYTNLVHGTNVPQTMMAYVPIFSSPTWSNANYNLVGTIAPPGSPLLDEHCSWLDADALDTMPIAITNTSWGSALQYPNNGCAIPSPLWTSSPSCGTSNPFTGPYVQEILGIPTSAAPTFSVQCSASPCNSTLGSAGQPYWRFGNTLISLSSWNFNAQNGTLSFSPLGHFYTFTSDWMCTLGTSTHTTISGGVPVGATPICGGAPWVASLAYSSGTIITPVKSNGGYCSYKAHASATSSANQPTWYSGGACLQNNGPGGTTGVCDGTWSGSSCTSGALWDYVGQNNMRADLFVAQTQ
jgi:hypothetical protein